MWEFKQYLNATYLYWVFDFRIIAGHKRAAMQIARAAKVLYPLMTACA
jgi:hypothetical protein